MRAWGGSGKGSSHWAELVLGSEAGTGGGGAMLRSPRGEPRLWGTWTQLEAGGCAKVAKSREISNPAFSHQRRRVLERTVVPIYSPQLLLILVAESRDADYIRPVRNHFS